MAKFTVGICGNLSFGTEDRLNPHKQLAVEGMHDFIAALAAEPVSREWIRANCPGLEPRIANLLDQGALREDGGRIWLNFTVFTAKDQLIIDDICRRDAHHLAAAIDRRRDDIWAILGRYPEKTVTLPQLAYTAVGALILDLLCLEWIADWGYAIRGKVQKSGDDYTLWATEQANVIDLKGVYWGCHSAPAASHQLITFGDHAPATVRRALPDEIWRARARAAKDAPRALADSADAWAQAVLDDTARALAALRSGEADAEPSRERSIALLKEYGYLSADASDRLRLAVPVLTSEDAAMFREVCTVVKVIVHDHLAERFFQLKEDLLSAGLTSLRHGVSFDEIYVQLWHYVFGFVNQQLASSGFMFDPYADGRWPGHMPAMYDLSLIK